MKNEILVFSATYNESENIKNFLNSIETLNLIEAGENLKAVFNILLSVTLCVSGCWLGMILGRQI